MTTTYRDAEKGKEEEGRGRRREKQIPISRESDRGGVEALPSPPPFPPFNPIALSPRTMKSGKGLFGSPLPTRTSSKFLQKLISLRRRTRGHSIPHAPLLCGLTKERERESYFRPSFSTPFVVPKRACSAAEGRGAM